jgi:hypothetical protein
MRQNTYRKLQPDFSSLTVRDSCAPLACHRRAAEKSSATETTPNSCRNDCQHWKFPAEVTRARLKWANEWRFQSPRHSGRRTEPPAGTCPAALESHPHRHDRAPLRSVPPIPRISSCCLVSILVEVLVTAGSSC